MAGDWFPECTYGQLLDQAVARFGDRPALTFEDETWTFTGLRDDVDRIAAGLIALGVEPGDRVALWMPNRPEWYASAFAVARIGAVLVPLNTGLRADDLRFVVEHAECRTMLLSPLSGPIDHLALLASAWPAGSGPLQRVVGTGPSHPQGAISWDEMLTAGSRIGSAEVEGRAAAVGPRDIVSVMYTSGTTGSPKGVVHSHHAVRNVVDQANRLNVRESDVLLLFLPLFHAYGFYEGPLLSLATGARCVLQARFDSAAALEAVERHRATMWFGFSTHFQALLDDPTRPGRDLTSLRAGILAVGPASMEHLARRVQAELPGKVVSGYGMTEIGVGATLGFIDEDEDHSAATSGYPLSGYEVRIVDPETGQECERGHPGEVLIRSYQVTEGYLHDPSSTARTIGPEGWLRSGDMGVLAHDGYLRIVGRYKDMLRVGGENVDPAEVEALYASHPAIEAAVLVGVPDPRLHEVGCLCVVPRPDRPIDVDELLHLVDGRIASFKRPRYVVCLDELPTTASGKVQRHEVAALAEERLR